MDFNIFLIRFGLNPDDYENKPLEPIVEGNTFYYHVEQKVTSRICPECGCNRCHIHDRYTSRKKCQQNEHIIDMLIVDRVRLKCPNCGHVFSLPLYGVNKQVQVSNQTEGFIKADLMRSLTFKEIGTRYGYTRSGMLKKFDQMFPIVPRYALDEIICIDEVSFECKEIDSPYACVISSYKTKRIIDILPSRSKPYLNEYFGSIPPGELKKVKVFISDMFTGFAAVHEKFFDHAYHVVDLFHVIKDLTGRVNSIRIQALNQRLEPGTIYYNFLNRNWDCFTCKDSEIPDKEYHHKASGITMSYRDLVFETVKLDKALWDGYSILQELLKYTTYHSYEEALRYIEHIIKRLESSCDESLVRLAATYKHFRFEIANAFRCKAVNNRYTNSTAETLNNHIKTLIKISYGCYNFERFRKRCLLIDINKRDDNAVPNDPTDFSTKKG